MCYAEWCCVLLLLLLQRDCRVEWTAKLSKVEATSSTLTQERGSLKLEVSKRDASIVELRT